MPPIKHPSPHNLCCQITSNLGSALAFTHGSRSDNSASPDDAFTLFSNADEARAVASAAAARASPAAVGEAQEAFHAVMERTSFGPARWATVSLEAVARLAGDVGQEE